MRKVLRLTEKDLTRIVKRVINESAYENLRPCKIGEQGELSQDKTTLLLSLSKKPFCKIVQPTNTTTSTPNKTTPSNNLRGSVTQKGRES
jgi:hypothetical protein